MSKHYQYGRQCYVCRRGLKKHMQVFSVPLDEWDNSWLETCSREHQLEAIKRLPKEGKYLDRERLQKIDPEAAEALSSYDGNVSVLKCEDCGSQDAAWNEHINKRGESDD